MTCGAIRLWLAIQRARLAHRLHRSSDGAGFTLLEVMIALVIAMIAITEILGGGGLALRSAEAASRHETAASLARSVLAGQTLSLTAGQRSGDAGDGFSWRVSVRPISTAQPVPAGAPPGAAAAAPRVTLFGVTVRVTWADGAGGGVEQIESRRLATRWGGT